MNKHQRTEILWHAMNVDEVARRLRTNPEAGLSVAEAARRLAESGRNALTPRRGRGPFFRFLLQFHQPLVYILLAAGVITAALREVVDSTVIFMVVLANAFIGFIQESKALQAIEALSRAMGMEAVVVRDGDRRRVPAADLTPGDIVVLAAGDKIPADVRILESRELAIDESMLTGESVPAHKTAEPASPTAALGDRRSIAYSSSLVTRGSGLGVVVATGDATEVGRISELLGGAEELQTPLIRKIARFSRLLLWVILAIAVATFLIGVLRGHLPARMFMAAVALSVGAIPEGLPAAMTIMLAVGVSRMASRRAIVRRLPAVEALGSATVICTDKTGTLTQNQMTVRTIVAGTEVFEVAGAGYDPSGNVTAAGRSFRLAERPSLELCLRAGVLCNDALIVNESGEWKIQGDPTEAALVVSAHKAGMHQPALQERFPRLDAIPFESDRQYMATLHSVAGTIGQPRLIFVKGSAERVLSMCHDELDRNGRHVALDAPAAQRRAANLASEGLRVLAFACRDAPTNIEGVSPEIVEAGLTFLGLQGMLDPPRAEAIAAVAACRRAGITVKMITGDHALTASSIASMIGLVDAASRDTTEAAITLTGADLARISDTDLPAAAERTAVFARMTPEQKLRLVKSLQSRGHIVAMTGDGVNDAPALRQADIGVAMGISGTEVAKEAADMVLADDNFASIEAAVEEGRAVFDNLTKFIIWTLPTNMGEALIILSSVLFGTALPILPVQALYVNMVTAILLGMPLVFEHKETDIMRRPPRNPKQPIMTYALLMRTGLVSLLLLAGGFGLFEWETARGACEAEARTSVVSAIVFGEMFYLFNCRSLVHSTWSIGVFSNPPLWAGVLGMTLVQVGFVHAPICNGLFQSAPLDTQAWTRVVAFGVAVFLIVGFEKWVRLRSGET